MVSRLQMWRVNTGWVSMSQLCPIKRAVSSRKIYSTCSGEARNTVRSLCRHFFDALPQDFFIPDLEENDRYIPHSWFQQDGATAHTKNFPMNMIRKVFAGREISRNCDILCPPRSPDFSPYDFFMQIPTNHYCRL